MDSTRGFRGNKMNEKQEWNTNRDHICFIRGAETPFQRELFIPRDSMKRPRLPKKTMEYKLIPAGCCRKRLEFLNALNNAQGQTFLPSLLLSTYRDGQKFHLGIFGMLPSDSTLGEGKQQRRKEPSPVLLQVLGLDPSLP